MLTPEEEKLQSEIRNAQAFGCSIQRSTMRDKLKARIERHSQDARHVERCNELYDLLNKNPEVARILELFEEIGGGI